MAELVNMLQELRVKKTTFKVVAGGTQYFIQAKVTMLGDSCVLA